MKKWLILALTILILIGGYIAAGPFLTVRAIRAAVAAEDTAALAEHIDFPALRSSFKQQLDDYIARQAGAEMQSSFLGAIAMRVTSGAAGGLVDTMATPAGLAMVMEGRNFWHRLNGSRRSKDATAAAPPVDPLAGAKYGFESPSRFTATVQNGDGEPVVFVLTREGLRWKLTDVRLPL